MSRSLPQPIVVGPVSEPALKPSSAPAEPPSRRFALLNAFTDRGQKGLTALQARIWFTLWRHADSSGVVRMMSQKRIAESVGAKADTVKKAMKGLRRRHVESKLKGFPGVTSIYQLKAGATDG